MYEREGLVSEGDAAVGRNIEQLPKPLVYNSMGNKNELISFGKAWLQEPRLRWGEKTSSLLSLRFTLYGLSPIHISEPTRPY